MDVKTLDEIVKETKDSLIDDMSRQILANIEKFDSDLDEEINSINDTIYEKVYEVADAAVPVYTSDVFKIAANELYKISEAYDRARAELGPESIGANERNFDGLLNIGIYHYIEQALLDNTELIVVDTKDIVIGKLKEKYDDSDLSNPNFILELIRTEEKGWPFAIASEKVKDNPIIALEALEYGEWVLQHASKRLYDLCASNDPQSALESEVLKTKLEKELPKESKPKRSSKI